MASFYINVAKQRCNLGYKARGRRDDHAERAYLAQKPARTGPMKRPTQVHFYLSFLTMKVPSV